MVKNSAYIDNNTEASKKNINFIANRLYSNIALKCSIALYALLAFTVFPIISGIFIDANFFAFASVTVLGLVALFIYCWPGQAKSNIKYLLKTNQQNIINEIFSGRVMCDPVGKIAFSETFFFCRKSKVIVPYKDVYWIYKKVHRTIVVGGGGYSSTEIDMLIYLNNGDSLKVNLKRRNPINGASFELALVQKIHQYNPNIMMGYSDANQMRYTALCESLKSPEQLAKEKKHAPFWRIFFAALCILLVSLMGWWVYHSFKTGDEESIAYIIIGAIVLVGSAIAGLVTKKKGQQKNLNDKKIVEITAPKLCCVFNYATVDEAMKDNKLEAVENFGGEGEGYSWSDGSRKLCRCSNCGALFLNYAIRFLAMTYDSDEIRYSYYLPVSSRDEALEYLKKFIGAAGLSDTYDGVKIWFDGRKWCWTKIK